LWRLVVGGMFTPFTPIKHRKISTRLLAATTQKTAIFRLIMVWDGGEILGPVCLFMRYHPYDLQKINWIFILCRWFGRLLHATVAENSPP
jgi:hypothetical protein